MRWERIFYIHQTVSHSEIFRDHVTGAHGNTIKGAWITLKYQLPLRNRRTSWKKMETLENLNDHFGEIKWRLNYSKIYREDSLETYKKLFIIFDLFHNIKNDLIKVATSQKIIE
ncbi:hypothetical protein RF11_10823 [Thelohanellus kitauei]|uniref:Uncharacterized protein n=1 Tax=Thelohanellus kitauei TaxID=669202 RepID=A0A0C2MWB7_THEKT|nr:hypothetical protein RF11_10823 [Thelohanellus kitauei]